jgi:hypothetical protein
MYFGGLFLGLAAGVALYKAKKAMMPHFHEVQETRAAATFAPGGSVRISYGGDEPGYFLVPGFPTSASLFLRTEGGQSRLVTNLGYSQLTEKDPLLGPLTEEGTYVLSGDFYICAEPGVADCAKLVLNHEIKVERNAQGGEDRVEINLPHYAQDALKESGDERNRVDDKAMETKPE